ncbi:hypothetical protein [Gilliamella apicola]|uniref:hypothetical protein n=1 Tax=Gilliamella apicola TaxID=1196095 RepID=UPI002FEE0337
MAKHTLTQTPSILKERSKWLTDNNLVQQSDNENYIQAESSTINQENLYQAYKN